VNDHSQKNKARQRSRKGSQVYEPTTGQFVPPERKLHRLQEKRKKPKPKIVKSHSPTQKEEVFGKRTTKRIPEKEKKKGRGRKIPDSRKGRVANWNYSQRLRGNPNGAKRWR